jgi:cob(I)alamin adenosyltransferase
MAIYTRAGDTGQTGFFDGTRVSKSDARVDAYGDVDETAAWLGLVRSTESDEEFIAILDQLQRDLFAVGALLADPDHRIAARVIKATLGDADVARLEQWIDRFDTELSPLRKFILSGGSPTSARLQLARAVCRRAERRIVGLGAGAVNPIVIAYMNRLSDLLFTMARAANVRSGTAEIEW